MSASQISIEYGTRVNTPYPLPSGIVVQFTVSNGAVNSPIALAGLVAPDLLISEHTGGGWSVIDKATGSSDLDLQNGSGHILYNLTSPSVSTSTNTLTGIVTLAPAPPPNNTTGINLANLNPASVVAGWPA